MTFFAVFHDVRAAIRRFLERRYSRGTFQRTISFAQRINRDVTIKERQTFKMTKDYLREKVLKEARKFLKGKTRLQDKDILNISRTGIEETKGQETFFLPYSGYYVTLRKPK